MKNYPEKYTRSFEDLKNLQRSLQGPAQTASPKLVVESQPVKDYSYNKELRRLQIELFKLQEWVRQKALKLVVIFEGRDAAGKGGAIKRITESLNPRACRVVALAAPTEREKSQWYFQRYVVHLPAA
jgi:polyphosphate kinase 2 (PPK2 family)